LAAVIPQRCSYIAGEWAGGDEAFAVQNPADETNVADVAGLTDHNWRCQWPTLH
jgi:aldehyde dehydrogenase (NAD+)